MLGNAAATPAELADAVGAPIEALPCGHYLTDEAPAETTAALRAFFARP